MIFSRNLREWPIPWIISGGVGIFLWRNSPKGQLEKFRFKLNIVSQRGSYMHTRSSELPPTLQVVLDPLKMWSLLFDGGDVSPPTNIKLQFITFMSGLGRLPNYLCSQVVKLVILKQLICSCLMGNTNLNENNEL